MNSIQVLSLKKNNHAMLSQPKDRWSIVLTIAALVHLFGITFYAIFASGELQPWAEPTAVAEGRPVITPSKIGYTEETSFNVRSHMSSSGRKHYNSH